MKRYMLHTILLLSLTAALLGCGGDGDGPQAPVTITASLDAITAPAEGATFVIDVTTTGNEWDAYATGDFFTISLQGTTTKKGSVTVTVPANALTQARNGAVVVMSGAARKTITVTQAAAEKPAYDAPDGYSLVWNDEFDHGNELNGDYWTHEVKNSGWVNNELQNYVNHITPGGSYVTELKDGKLRITCLKENGKIYSGRVYAKAREGWKYGYIEASIKLPKGKGTWPAFWMMPVNFQSWPADGEIDIGEFHKYAILWTEQNITTYVDDKVQLSYDNRGLGHDDWPYDAPFYIILNLAWGGDWGGAQGVNENALPVTMEVDYVRVFQKK